MVGLLAVRFMGSFNLGLSFCYKVVFFFFFNFFILMVLTCTKSKEIVDVYIVLPYYGLGFLFIYFFLSFTCWFFYLMVWIRMEKMKNFSL